MYVQIERARDMAPAVRYMTEEGPVEGIHPDVQGFVITALDEKGKLYILDGFGTEDESEDSHRRAQNLLLKIQLHLDSGKELNLNHWTFLRAIYGSTAWEEDFNEKLEVHLNLGGDYQEFMANN